MGASRRSQTIRPPSRGGAGRILRLPILLPFEEPFLRLPRVMLLLATSPHPFVSKESFQYPQSQDVFRQIEEISQRSGVSRAIAFEDLLECSVSALGHPAMEEEYLATIEKHKVGMTGKRGVDTLAAAFATLIEVTSQTRKDILGDIFQGAITYGERGQFLTPGPLAAAMCRLNLPAEDTGLERRRTISDPCCGSGRMLLAAAEIQPAWHFVGQDVDRRCVLMCSIGLALRNAYGHVVWGNSLTNEVKQIYETGRLQVWGNAIRKVSRVPLPDRPPETIGVDIPTPQREPSDDAPEEAGKPKSQLHLF